MLNGLDSAVDVDSVANEEDARTSVAWVTPGNRGCMPVHEVSPDRLGGDMKLNRS